MMKQLSFFWFRVTVTALRPASTSHLLDKCLIVLVIQIFWNVAVVQLNFLQMCMANVFPTIVLLIRDRSHSPLASASLSGEQQRPKWFWLGLTRDSFLSQGPIPLHWMRIATYALNCSVHSFLPPLQYILSLLILLLSFCALLPSLTISAFSFGRLLLQLCRFVLINSLPIII